MVAKQTNTKKTEGAAVAPFLLVRCIKRNVSVKPAKNISIVEDKDFKVGPYNEIEIVSLGKTDWCQKVNRHKNDVGLAAVVAAAAANHVDPASLPFSFKPEVDARDVSIVQPLETMSDVAEKMEKVKGADKALENIASAVGCSIDDLVEQHIAGKLDEFVKAKQKEQAAKLESEQ